MYKEEQNKQNFQGSTCEVSNLSIISENQSSSRSFLNSHIVNLPLSNMNSSHFKEEAKYKNNLAMIMAKKLPVQYQKNVVEIVKYYEEHMEDQLKTIHKLVEQNHQLKHKVQKFEDKQNNLCQTESSLKVKDARVNELQECVMEKNKQMSNLNKQITELLTKIKKYKKRIYELEAKLPKKSASSEFA